MAAHLDHRRCLLQVSHGLRRSGDDAHTAGAAPRQQQALQPATKWSLWHLCSAQRQLYKG